MSSLQVALNQSQCRVAAFKRSATRRRRATFFIRRAHKSGAPVQPGQGCLAGRHTVVERRGALAETDASISLWSRGCVACFFLARQRAAMTGRAVGWLEQRHCSTGYVWIERNEKLRLDGGQQVLSDGSRRCAYVCSGAAWSLLEDGLSLSFRWFLQRLITWPIAYEVSHPRLLQCTKRNSAGPQSLWLPQGPVDRPNGTRGNAVSSPPHVENRGTLYNSNSCY